MEPNGILIYGELTADYKVRPVTAQLITKARELNQTVKVCVIGKNTDYNEIVKELESFGADEVIIVNDDRLKFYDKNYYPEIFYQISTKYMPRIILIGATIQGKELASYAATKLNTGLTADCTNLSAVENNMLLSTRPTFGGQLTADILCRTFPQMATVQENVFKSRKIENTAIVKYEHIDLEKIERKIEVINIIKKELKNQDVTSADIVIAGGLGACKENGFELIAELAKKLNAAVAGSREAFERGYISKSQQIGQTGKTVAPKLYIAAGISGANQHIAGIKNSGKIIAINKDKTAPIFKYADFGITGDLFEILKELIKNIDTKEKEIQ